MRASASGGRSALHFSHDAFMSSGIRSAPAASGSPQATAGALVGFFARCVNPSGVVLVALAAPLRHLRWSLRVTEALRGSDVARAPLIDRRQDYLPRFAYVRAPHLAHILVARAEGPRPPAALPLEPDGKLWPGALNTAPRTGRWPARAERDPARPRLRRRRPPLPRHRDRLLRDHLVHARRTLVDRAGRRRRSTTGDLVPALAGIRLGPRPQSSVHHLPGCAPGRQPDVEHHRPPAGCRAGAADRDPGRRLRLQRGRNS